MRQKVQAYITRETPGGLQILVFDHVGAPEAGTQVPDLAEAATALSGQQGMYLSLL